MVLIHAGLEELDAALNKAVHGSKIVFYPEYLLNDNQGKIVILSPRIHVEMQFKDFLFALRQRNKRVILLLDTPESEHLGYALALGIYDIIFDPITVEKVVYKVKHPAKFSDVQELFLRHSIKVAFEGVPVEKEQEEQQEQREEEQQEQREEEQCEKQTETRTVLEKVSNQETVVEIQKELEKELRKKLEREIRCEIENELREQLKLELRQEIEQQIKAEKVGGQTKVSEVCGTLIQRTANVSDSNMEVEQVTAQLLGIFRLLNKKPKTRNLPEMLVELEDTLVKLLL